jgi:hypothetical protein
MTKEKIKNIKWLPDVEEHDYPAAESYLTILYSEEKVADMVAKLRSAAISHFKAKDIFRATQLSLLGVSNSHVEKDREKTFPTSPGSGPTQRKSDYCRWLSPPLCCL